jgi:hypothetical protein
MLEMFPREIDRLPRPVLAALLNYIKEVDQCDDPLLVDPIAKVEGKLIIDYTNEWLRAVGRYLVRRGFVTCDRIDIGGGMQMGVNYRVTSKGERYLDRLWGPRLLWDELKDFAARMLAHKMEP